MMISDTIEEIAAEEEIEMDGGDLALLILMYQNKESQSNLISLTKMEDWIVTRRLKKSTSFFNYMCSISVLLNVLIQKLRKGNFIKAKVFYKAIQQASSETIQESFLRDCNEKTARKLKRSFALLASAIGDLQEAVSISLAGHLDDPFSTLSRSKKCTHGLSAAFIFSFISDMLKSFDAEDSLYHLVIGLLQQKFSGISDN